MPPTHLLLLLVLATLGSVLLPGSPARAQCNLSFVEMGGQRFAGPAAAPELAHTDSVHWNDFPPDWPYLTDGSGYARVALATRRFAAASHAGRSLYFTASARDEYRVAGVPDGAEVTFRMRLTGVVEFVYYVYCGGSGCGPVAGITIDGRPDEHLEMIGLGPFRDLVAPFDRSISLTRRAGEPFTLDYYMMAGTSHSPAYVSIDARVEFEDLPAGARVVSCLEDYLATESRPGSWGSLKLRYR